MEREYVVRPTNPREHRVGTGLSLHDSAESKQRRAGLTVIDAIGNDAQRKRLNSRARFVRGRAVGEHSG